MPQNALRLFTSCAWFFDDIEGIEATQVLRYAARAIDLMGHEATSIEVGFYERLELARGPGHSDERVQAYP